jgi:stage III sporulation protein AG
MKAEMMNIVKKDKKKLLILAILAVTAVVLMIIGDGVAEGKKSVAVDNNTSVSSVGEDYFAATEADLSEALSQMDGVGEVKVLISWDGDISEDFAYNEESTEKTDGDGVTEKSTKNELVLTDGDSAPVTEEKIYPEITGVLVVAQGAENEEIRRTLLLAVSAYLSVGTNRIEITAMEE